MTALSASACAEIEDALDQLQPPDSSVGTDGSTAFPDGSLPLTDAGTGSDGGLASDGGIVNGNGIPCAVRTILRDKCVTCHADAPLFGAPMSLASYAALHAPAKSDPSKKALVVSQERINATVPALMMPPSNQPQLDAAELSTLNAWLAQGAPQSNETCNDDPAPTPDAGAPIDTTGLECHKLLAHAPGSKTAPYKVGVARDKYINFRFANPWQGTAYGIVVRPIIDNAQVLHHWLLFQLARAPQDGSIADSSGAHPDGELVHGWAPGGNPLNFRTEGDVGFEFANGGGFEVEIHYNSTDANAEDASGLEICIQREKPSNLAGISWLGTDVFFGTTAKSTCTPASSQPIQILGVSPHMHLKGIHMKGTIVRANGTREVLHDAPFDFDNQTWYDRKATLMPGDKIETECTWSELSWFGKATTDEMCYLFTVAYPRGALADGLPVGSAAHGAGACLGI